MNNIHATLRTNSHRVEARMEAAAARMVIGYTDVIDVGDTLLTGTLSQTWRFAAVCECHSITFYEVMI